MTSIPSTASHHGQEALALFRLSEDKKYYRKAKASNSAPHLGNL